MCLKCPNCNQELIHINRQYRCINNHQFDQGKSGYVNLLQSQQANTKNHGDDLTMLRSRKAFLDEGYYLPLAHKIKAIIDTLPHNTILDVGCGEGYYSQQIDKNIIGIDISKYACDLSAKRNKQMTFAVASAFDLPIMDGSINIAYSVFAPFSPTELSRVLKDNGHFIQVYPLPDHLMGLKQAIYDTVYENDPNLNQIEGFTLQSTYEVHDSITLNSNVMIKNLFSMTPYVHRTKAHELKRLEALNTLETQIAFGISVFKKNI